MFLFLFSGEVMIEKKGLIAPKTESEITQHWDYSFEGTFVSIICPCFNHEGYIEKAIDGFLAQELRYPFEIIIHDDASNDRSRDIILRYKEKYPNLIKLILQEENQYSQGRKVQPIAFALSSGKYIAICEGDDYWVDREKLQKQVSLMEQYPDKNLCFSAGYGLQGEDTFSEVSSYGEDQTFDLKTIILHGGGFMPTASLLIRRCVFESLPDWFFDDAPVADYYFQMLGGVNDALYIHDKTCVYRQNSHGSWSSKRKTQTKKKIDNFYSRHQKCLELFLSKEGEKESANLPLYTANLNLHKSSELALNGYLKSAITLCSKNVDTEGLEGVKYNLMSRFKFLTIIYVLFIYIRRFL